MSTTAAALQHPQDLAAVLGVPLSQEQIEAATAPLEPGLIVAGAGAGKTTVMAARVVWLVGTGAVPAGGVLGLTFTNKAAAELSHRIRGALRRLSASAAKAADDALVTTYHSFAGQLLREFGLLIGVEPTAELMSPVRQRQLAHHIATTASVDHEAMAGTPSDLAAAIVSMDALLADSDVSTDDLRDFDDGLIAALRSGPAQQVIGTRMLAAARSRCEVARLVEDYRGAKRARELVDFADYVRLGAQLARRHPGLGQMIKQRHSAVLLDEYQDTSVAQRGMLQALFDSGHPVTAVGDPCQAIYGWRGASPYNIDAFPRHFPLADGRDAPVRALATNRRSGARILDVANTIAARLRAVHTDVVRLRPDAGNGTGSVICALLPTIADEMSWLCGRVMAQGPSRTGRPWSDIAVLVRTNDSAAEVVAALRSAGIPVQAHGKQALLALPEVRWIVWALAVVGDPTANDALVGLVAGPPWRIGARDLALLAKRAADLSQQGARDPSPGPRPTIGQELLATLLPEPLDSPCLLDALHERGKPAQYPYSDEARSRLSAASALIASWQRRAHSSVADLVAAVALESGLSAELALGATGGAPGAPSDDSALVALIDLARRFDDIGGGRSLTEFLDWINVADTLPDGPDAPSPPVTDAVTVMTVHAAKGLEFPVVAVPGLVEGGFPSARGRGLWPTSPKALPGDLVSEPRAGALSFPDDPTLPRAAEFTAFAAASREADRLEEVRLAYVAMTRAKQTLILSGHRWGRTQLKPREPSEFLLAAVTGDSTQGDSTQAAELDVWTLPPDDGAVSPMLAKPEVAGVQESADAPAGPDWSAVAESVASAAEAGPLPLTPQEAAIVAGWDRDLATLRAELAWHRRPMEVTIAPEVSVSQWMALARDPQAYALQSLRPVPMRPSRTAEQGEELHEWLAASRGQLALWEEDDLIEAEDLAMPMQQELRQAFHTSPFGGLAPIAVEHPVALAVAGRVVRGRIDAVFQIGGDHWVVDWKTGESGRADPVQLALYRAAWAIETGMDPERVVGCFVFLRSCRYDVYRGLPGPDGLRRMLADATVADRVPRSGSGLRPAESITWGGDDEGER